MLENPTHSDFFIDIVNVDFMYVDEEAHQPPGESEVLQGNQQQHNKQLRSFISFVRLWIGII
ncbi:hypothetical protein ABEP16_15790 [Priestia aryabhattai]|uniref:hypothetical protein n=1 Tax=Priestia TaxID=2800373 RepID=UPI003001D2DB